MSILRDNVNGGPDRLRELLDREFVVAPGVFNGISARLAENTGFNSMYLSGSGVAGAMGLPDLSVTTSTEVAEEIRRICSASSLPLIVDADTGFGEPINVVRTVRLFEDAGAAAIHLEDQVLPKRCGHLNGKKIVDREEMVRKIKVAVDSRKNSNFTIIARTDARSVMGVNEAIERSNLFLEAGADMIFTEALESPTEFAKFGREVKGPLLANMTEFGKSPLMSVDELEKAGYNAVIFPLTAFRVSLKSIQNTYAEIRAKGTQRDYMENLMTRSEFYDLIGYDTYEKEDRELSEIERK